MSEHKEVKAVSYLYTLYAKHQGEPPLLSLSSTGQTTIQMLPTSLRVHNMMLEEGRI